MVKTNRYPSRTPEWTKLPQYKNSPVMFDYINDVEMEGIQAAIEEKPVLRQGLRRKRTSADSGFGITEETSAKRFKVPELRRVQAEQYPAFSGLINILINNKKHRRQPLSLHIEKDRASSGIIAQTLLSDSFSDTTTLPKPIDLIHEDPLLVKHYVGWANTGKITTSKRSRWVSQERRSESDYKEEMTLDIEKLALYYGLGERLEDAKYRNALLCTIRSYVVKEEFFPSYHEVAIMYEHTSKGSLARKMMVDFWAHAGSLSWLGSESVRFAICREFLEDLLPALLQVRAKPGAGTWPWADNADAYLITDGETRTEEACVLQGESMEL